MAQQGIVYENSYQLPSGQVPISKIKSIADQIIEKKFKELKYDHKAMSIKIKEATDEISKALKEKEDGKDIISKRYKYMVQLTVSENVGQAFFSGSMCLWDPEHDNYVRTSFEQPTFTVICVIFCSLLE